MFLQTCIIGYMLDSSTITLTARDGITYAVATGALCLDFCYTGGRGDRAHWETLHAPADLARWARASRLREAGAVPSLIVDASAFADAVDLREVVWRTANAIADGHAVNRRDAAHLSRWAAVPDIAPGLSPTGPTWARPVTGAQLVSTLARDAIDVLVRRHQLLRRCAADDCQLLFLDTSRPGTRRWCAMARCGNRTKVRQFRERQGH